jgi:SagB-type dehydrogenase family enzyme
VAQALATPRVPRYPEFVPNRDLDAARRYHNSTKHSVESLQAHQHYLDWDNKPLPFKVYPHIEGMPLPRQLPPSEVPALRALATPPVSTGGLSQVPDLQHLARLLYFAAGITRKKVYPGGQEYHFRAAACTGALYHIDVYVICRDLPGGLAAGVYHFGPHNFALHQLRAGDHRGVLVEATGGEPHGGKPHGGKPHGGEPSVAHAPVILACASTYWRNAWKYTARAYRHCFWDTGTILANLLAVAAADTMPARVVCGFVDQTVSALLGLDPQREGPLVLVSVGHDPDRMTAPQPAVPSISVETLPLSAHEVDYPAIRDMQAASVLLTAEEVRAWRAMAGAHPAMRPPSGQTFPLQPFGAPALPGETIDSVIQRRGSTRQFARVPISFEELSTILQHGTHGVATDFGNALSDLYLIVNAVDGLPSGTYVFHRVPQVLELLRAGDFRREAGILGLGQELPADASVNIYLLCDLERVLACFGNRGYRVAQLDAAITGGKLYLASYALRRGATGLTFLDDDVTAFFSPHAAGKSVMFLVAIGHGQRALPRRIS